MNAVVAECRNGVVALRLNFNYPGAVSQSSAVSVPNPVAVRCQSGAHIPLECANHIVSQFRFNAVIATSVDLFAGTTVFGARYEYGKQTSRITHGLRSRVREIRNARRAVELVAGRFATSAMRRGSGASDFSTKKPRLRVKQCRRDRRNSRRSGPTRRTKRSLIAPLKTPGAAHEWCAFACFLATVSGFHPFDGLKMH